MNSSRVLIVDDDLSVAKIIHEFLKSLFGWHADVADSPDKVFELLDNACYDMVITDLNLRNSINGADVILRVKECCPHARTVLMSGNLGQNTFQSSLEKAMPEIDRVWKKPVSLGVVKKTIQDIIGEEVIE